MDLEARRSQVSGTPAEQTRAVTKNKPVAEDRTSGSVCTDVTGEEKAPGMEEGLLGAQRLPGEDGLRKDRRELGLGDGRGLGEARCRGVVRAAASAAGGRAGPDVTVRAAAGGRPLSV